MGAIFNTPGTQQIINLLSTTFTTNFTTTAANLALIYDLDPDNGMGTYKFCQKYNLVAIGVGARTINLHWEAWLTYFDAHGGNAARKAMVAALGNTAKYQAIEFFPYFDPKTFNVTHKDANFHDGTCSLAVTAQTPTYDNLP